MMVRSFSIILILLISTETLSAWGFHAHRIINRMAVFSLPPEMLAFYKSEVAYLTDNSVRADRRRYADPDEAPRHYIDIDFYGSYPFDSLPREWDEAVKKFPEDTLIKYGILPWHLEEMYDRLVWAFREKNATSIIYLSADIGHYISDGHSPLHTTLNYNGQLTDQVGIHALWESRLPELFSDEYDFFVDQATYIGDPLDKAFDIILHSYLRVDSLLTIEREVSDTFPSDAKYAYEQRGQSNIRVYSRDFCRVYHDAMHGMVERQMQRSIHMIGSFWFSAWVDAGQPDLSDITDMDKLGTDDVLEKPEARPGEEQDKDWIGRPDQ